MADAAALFVEALYQLRASIDAMAQDQALARGNAVGEGLALSIVDGLSGIRGAIDNMADSQAKFQRDVMSVLSDISQAMPLASATGTLEMIERDVSLIADRYRPFDNEGS